MTRGLALLAGLPALAILAELLLLPGGSAADPAIRAAAVQAGPALVGQPADWAAISLTRPVFDPDRHRIADVGGASLPGLPRLSGILVAPDRRHALFAIGDRTTVVDEGGQIGGYVVRSIEPDRVVVQNVAGRHVLRPGFARMRSEAALPSGRIEMSDGPPASPPPASIPPPLTLPQPARPGTSR